MTAFHGYQWFLTLAVRYTAYWWDIENDSNHPRYKILMQGLQCDGADMWTALQGVIFHSHATQGPEQSRIMGNMTVIQWRERYNEELRIVVSKFYLFKVKLTFRIHVVQ